MHLGIISPDRWLQIEIELNLEFRLNEKDYLLYAITLKSIYEHLLDLRVEKSFAVRNIEHLYNEKDNENMYYFIVSKILYVDCKH